MGAGLGAAWRDGAIPLLPGPSTGGLSLCLLSFLPLPCKLCFPFCFLIFSPVPPFLCLSPFFLPLCFSIFLFHSVSHFLLNSETLKNSPRPQFPKGALTGTPSLGFGTKGLCGRKFKSGQEWAGLSSGQVRRCLGEGSGQDPGVACAPCFPNLRWV